MKRDYYEILGVSKDSSPSDIKKAYRKLALSLHPDKNPDDPRAGEKFKEATEAYQVLSNEETKARYDRFGHAGMEGFSGFAFEDVASAAGVFGDIFGAFFGQSAYSGANHHRGKDLMYELEITLDEAAKGVEKKITFHRNLHCETCKGSGTKPGHEKVRCKTCEGLGQVRFQQGFFSVTRTCPDCSGSGRVVETPCETCSGRGLKLKEAQVMVKVPPGIDNGQRLKLCGEGEAGEEGGPSGDLYVGISVLPHEVFHRQGSEIICEVPITYSQAVLGSSIRVPTLNGEEELKIPSGTPSGKVFKLRKKGIVDLNSGHCGDLKVRIYVHVPDSVSDNERELLEKLAELEGTPVKDGNLSFLDRMRNVFEL